MTEDRSALVARLQDVDRMWGHFSLDDGPGPEVGDVIREAIAVLEADAAQEQEIAALKGEKPVDERDDDCPIFPVDVVDRCEAHAWEPHTLRCSICERHALAAKDEEIAALKAQRDRLDCTQREGGGTRHCPLDRKCLRCERDALRADIRAWKRAVDAYQHQQSINGPRLLETAAAYGAAEARLRARGEQA